MPRGDDERLVRQASEEGPGNAEKRGKEGAEKAPGRPGKGHWEKKRADRKGRKEGGTSTWGGHGDVKECRQRGPPTLALPHVLPNGKTDFCPYSDPPGSTSGTVAFCLLILKN